MRWIFVRNAMKCGEIFIFTAIIAFLTKIHRIHRISYNNKHKNRDPGNNHLDQKFNADWSSFSFIPLCLFKWRIFEIVVIVFLPSFLNISHVHEYLDKNLWFYFFQRVSWSKGWRNLMLLIFYIIPHLMKFFCFEMQIF